ncbi:thioredoxin domain-containing protein [Actinoplanes sp. NPDC051346]|uniref:DsbA family protein n=1 Tax=Actinoplanes sp. NPDC051346 TaxID=3155048 RepID=UPI00342273A4
MSKGVKERTKAKQVVREQLARERRRTVTLWTTVGVIAVLVIAGLVGWGVAAGQAKDTAGKLTVPPSAVDDGTAFARGSGPVTVDIYEDFICPGCRQVETTTGPTITGLVQAGKVTVRYHPIAILDRYSTTQYSTRAASASAAAADGGKFLEFHDALFAQQPPEGGAGLDDAKLIEIGRSVGLTDEAFADAVNGKKYKAWATKVTDTASARGVVSTPTVFVAGKPLERPTPDALTAAVEAAGA